MKPIPSVSAAPAGTTTTCDVFAIGAVQATLENIPALRQRPGPVYRDPLPNNFLKHADEQTVLALAAVLRAIDDFQMGEETFRDWGIVAAPHFFGRATLVSALQRFAAEGAWGLSPHFIPHKSQHAVSGTISQALKVHGPNFGAGGGPGGPVDALLAGAALLEGNGLPGVWVVMTGYDPEFIPDEDGKPQAEITCHGVAMALVGARSGWAGSRIKFVPKARSDWGSSTSQYVARTSPNLLALAKSIADPNAPAISFVWQIDGGGWLELTRPAATTVQHPPATVQGPHVRAGVELKECGAGMETQR